MWTFKLLVDFINRTKMQKIDFKDLIYVSFMWACASDAWSPKGERDEPKAEESSERDKTEVEFSECDRAREKRLDE